ncbi:hypothetical protein BH20ACI2_BH20ACI2_20290 [soil metagenome]
MNSEELEQSLRSEFETYLNGVLSEMRQESAEFRNKIEAEFDRHRALFDEGFGAIAARLDTAPGFNEAFSSSIAEHLKLARDEGAKIAANAMVEAEKFDERTAPAARYDAIRDAVNDVSSKDSQSAILKSLVQHAAEFAPRGAFFIIKSNHFAGWKVFGTADEMEKTILEIHFPVSQDTILAKSIEALSTVESHSGNHSEDNSFVDPLAFGQPEKMMALPLIARGRGVAVMYVDGGESNGDVNREALETLVKVAGLTVELLASTQTAAEENRTLGAADFENTRNDYDDVQPVHDNYVSAYSVNVSAISVPLSEVPAPPAGNEPADFSFTESLPGDSEYSPETVREAAPEYGMPFQERPIADTLDINDDSASQFEATIPAVNEFERSAFAQDFEQPASAPDFERSHVGSRSEAESESAMEYSFGTPEVAHDLAEDQGENAATDFPVEQSNEFQAPPQEFRPAGEPDHASQFDAPRSIDPATVASPFDRAVEQYKPATAASGTAYTPAPEPVVPAPAASPQQARFGDRPVDLPIDVPEDERRLHNDARRFARLLVSEIKLYNEKKVIEGKQAHDLYERLREAIDRSREMYDKRVQPPVASKFDYFHYEVLNSLAEGSVERLGEGYPGASV